MQKQRTTDKSDNDIDLLVDRAKGGDGDAFGSLYDMHVDRIYKHVYYRVGNRADAEDITQQVFIKAWQAIGRYKKTASPFIAWLVRISHNLVVDFYRSKKSETYLDFDIVAARPDMSPEPLAETHFDQQQLRRAILELRGDQKQVIMMRFIEDFSYAEIAASLGKSEGAVRVTLHRGLSRLRKIMEKIQQ